MGQEDEILDCIHHMIPANFDLYIFPFPKLPRSRFTGEKQQSSVFSSIPELAEKPPIKEGAGTYEYPVIYF